MAQRQRIMIAPTHPDAEPMVRAVTEGGMPPGATTIYKGRRNTLFYILPGDPAEEQRSGAEPRRNDLTVPVNVKAFRVPPFPNGYVYRSFRKSKAERSYLNARRLIEEGFFTPEPIAYSEVHTGPWAGAWIKMTRSYYFCRQLPFPNIRGCEGWDDSEALTEALGAEMVRLHRAGVWFHDFSPGNILVERLPQGGYRFYYVDLNRMDFGVTDRHKLMQMFKSISWDMGWIERLARAYARAAGEDEQTVVAEALEATTRWRKGHMKKERFKQLIGK